MRILLAGDTHRNPHHLLYLLGIAVDEGVTIVFVVGDFGALEHTSKGAEFFETTQHYAQQCGITVYFLDGNHDKTSLVIERYADRLDEEGFLICRPRVRYAPRGHRWSWGGVRFMAFGGAYSVDKMLRLEWEHRERKRRMERVVKYGSTVNPDTSGMHWFPEEQATEQDVQRILAADSSPIDVLLTHDKPNGATPPGWTYNQPDECYPNQERIQRLAEALRPKLLVHGHLHYPYQQLVPIGGAARMQVIGLDCDGPSFYPHYDPTNSWMVLDLDEPPYPLEAADGVPTA